MIRGLSLSVSACTGIAFLLAACSCFFLGAGMTFFVAPAEEEEARELAQLPAYDAVADGERAYATGTLTDNPTAKEAEQTDEIAQYELVAYRVEMWEVKRRRTGDTRNSTGRTTYRGSWRLVETYVPEITLDLGTEEISVLPDDAIEWGAAGHETIVASTGNGYSDTYNGTNLVDGSLRITGFRNGDMVTVVGQRSGDTLINADKLHGGTRDDLVTSVEASATAFKWIGVVMMICGPLMMLPALLISGVFGAVGLFGGRKSEAVPV